MKGTAWHKSSATKRSKKRSFIRPPVIKGARSKDDRMSLPFSTIPYIYFCMKIPSVKNLISRFGTATLTRVAVFRKGGDVDALIRKDAED